MPWLKRREYLELLSKMSITSQITYGESFNYTLLDSLLVGVPCLAPAWTPAARFAPAMCRITLVEDVKHVRERALEAAKAFQDLKSRQELASRVRQEVSDYNCYVTEQWRKVLGG